MRGLSGFLFLGGISMFLNAVSGQWAFDFSKKSGGYIVLDIVIGIACWLASAFFWRVRVVRSVLRGRDPETGAPLPCSD